MMIPKTHQDEKFNCFSSIRIPVNGRYVFL